MVVAALKHRVKTPDGRKNLMRDFHAGRVKILTQLFREAENFSFS